MGSLTKKQNDFIVHYVATRNASKSALNAGYSKSFAKSKSHELLKNPLIKEKITHLAESFYKEQFQSLALASIKELSGVLEDLENRSTQLQAIKYVLSEAKITEQSDSQTGIIEIKVKLPNDL